MIPQCLDSPYLDVSPYTHIIIPSYISCVETYIGRFKR